MKLRVVSYNIRNGHDVRHDMSLLAADILSVGADIVGLQEVDVRTSRAGGRDTLAELARALGWVHCAFCRAIDFAGGQYGTAILSCYPINAFEIIPLPTPASAEGRSVGHAVLDADGERVDFFNTHLSVESGAMRAPQFELLADLTAQSPSWILTGDFNTADLSCFDGFEGASLANPGKYATFPASGEGIDNILCSPDWHIVGTGTLQNHHSDHLLLWADIEK
ncbi:MAG: hypothetical protein E7594_09550 [Ruminococcaceae bacterium]|nr:hypothetical protein [Oscillospiraceae bacterium]